MNLVPADVNVSACRREVCLRNCGELDFIATRLRGSKRKTREIWIEKLEAEQSVKLLEL